MTTQKNKAEEGILYLVPTPIGNLGDMTYRAVEVLIDVDLVACEDTRTSATLFQRYGIQTKRTPFHAHNEHRKTADLVRRLHEGLNLALVTDAGSPGISDPGFMLVRECIEQGIRVEALPGPTAFVPALSASGLPSDRFLFEGFLPPKKGRMKRLTDLAGQDRTIVLYEAPHRLKKLFEQLNETFGADRPAVIAREISKKFEEYLRGSVGSLLIQIQERDRIKGEMVVIIAGVRYRDRLVAAEKQSDDSGHSNF